VDLSNWTLTVHPAQQAIFSSVNIPAATKLAAHGFYLLGLSNSGLAVAAHAGDSIIHVRSTAGMKPGDTIGIDTGSATETRKIASLGTAASNNTTLWQPLPDGPVITLAPNSTNVPVTSVEGFVVGQKIALGHGATYPSVARDLEQYEVATVTAVGKPGTQAYLAADAPAGADNIQVTDLSGISVGDMIRLDIESVGHGIETVTVTHVGTKASQSNVSGDAHAGATHIKVRSAEGFAVGDKITVGAPANKETVTVTAIRADGPNGAGIDFKPALAKTHIRDEWVVSPGTGLDLAAPLKFNHAANLPFSDRGSGINFEPPAAFAHSSNEPVMALGAGITLSSPLASSHHLNAAVRDAAVTTAGYQGTPAPDLWFGGPELTSSAPLFGHTINVKEGSLVLRDASGLVVDSLNYGGLVDPWAAKGYQAKAGLDQSGCRVAVPGSAEGFGPEAAAGAANSSAGRFPDGADTDSNCTDFLQQAATTLRTASAAGATNIKVAGVEGFAAGRTILIDTRADQETAAIATVGTAGATTQGVATSAGATVIPVADVIGFSQGQSITIDRGANAEIAVIASINWWGGATITVVAPLRHAHAPGAQVSGSGITLTTALTKPHFTGAQVGDNLPTPGAPNRYYRKSH
jgi:hypothetical protein